MRANMDEQARERFGPPNDSKQKQAKQARKQASKQASSHKKLLDELKSVCLSPDDLVKQLTLQVHNVILQNGFLIDGIVDACAADGRLGRAMKLLLPRGELLMFDTHPRAKDVVQANLLLEDHVRQISGHLQKMMGRANLVNALLLNPPFNPWKEVGKYVQSALSLEGVVIAGLILPGSFMKYDRLHDILPPFWHVAVCEEMEGQIFDQPLLQSKAEDIRVALVVVVRKCYARQASPPQSKSKLFTMVGKHENWHQKFRCVGFNSNAITVRNNDDIGNEVSATKSTGTWHYVHYNCKGQENIKRVCAMVTSRVEYMSKTQLGRRKHSNRTWFPAIGTTRNYIVPKEALVDWLNFVLNGDALFFQGRVSSNDANEMSDDNVPEVRSHVSRNNFVNNGNFNQIYIYHAGQDADVADVEGSMKRQRKNMDEEFE